MTLWHTRIKQMRANWYHTNFKRIWTTIIYLFEHNHNILPSPDLTFGVDIICSAFGSGFDFIYYGPSPVYIFCCSWSGFYLFWVRSGFYHVSPGPDFIYFESGSGFYPSSPCLDISSEFPPLSICVNILCFEVRLLSVSFLCHGGSHRKQCKIGLIHSSPQSSTTFSD